MLSSSGDHVVKKKSRSWISMLIETLKAGKVVMPGRSHQRNWVHATRTIFFALLVLLRAAVSAGATVEQPCHGEHIAKNDVVVATIGHRLSPLGFLAHPELSAEHDRYASGNYGLFDIIAGLEWVQKWDQKTFSFGIEAEIEV
jgi:hypothetical protein